MTHSQWTIPAKIMMIQQMNASILAIGTELTSGQILNKNAHWISQKLAILGMRCNWHLAVPDEHRFIIKALLQAEQDSDFIFVTGGLGPTTDDFTRQVVSEWAKLPLQFDQSSWQHLNNQLAQRGVSPKEFHRQECYFPMTAEILKNNIGTANGFYLSVRGKHVFVLPGPPSEIEAIWNDFAAQKMAELTIKIDRHLTMKWQTIGQSESDIANLIQPITKDCPFEIGYRVHLPYIEVKLHYQNSQSLEAHPWIKKIETALTSFLILKGEDTSLELLKKFLQNQNDVTLLDQVTNTVFLEKVLSILRNKHIFFTQKAVAEKKFDLEILKTTSPTKFTLRCQDREISLQIPHRLMNVPLRTQQYAAEMAILFWCEQLPQHIYQ